MLRLSVQPDSSKPLRLLCLGAHPDDIEIGCGGTLLSILERHPDCVVKWVVFSGDEQRRQEADAAARLFLTAAGEIDLCLETFKDGFFPDQWADIKRFFEHEVKPFEPQLILTHYRDDRHQDHRVVSDLTWNTFRSHLILEYEVLKYDGDLGQPNLYCELEKEICTRKVDAILAAFASQSERHWFDSEAFWSMLRIRGVEATSKSGLAEAFYGRKVVL